MLALDMETMTKQCSDSSNETQENLYIGMLLHLPILSTYTTYNLFVAGMKKGCELFEIHKQKALKHEELKEYIHTAKKNYRKISNAQTE